LRVQGIAFKRPRPFLRCPDPDREAKLAHIAELKASLPDDERLFSEDEVDIHFNPKLGPAWSHKGEQPLVLTPGKNKKAYVAGALCFKTGEVTYVIGQKKRSELFLQLIKALVERYPEAKRIHLVVDNYIIHHSKLTQKALRVLPEFRDRVVLHPLPTYSPEENPIEGLWKDLHACVTRNHDAKDLDELIARVKAFLKAAEPYPGNRPSLARAS
jgi:transposase